MLLFARFFQTLDNLSILLRKESCESTTSANRGDEMSFLDVFFALIQLILSLFGGSSVTPPAGPRWKHATPPSFLIGGVLHGFPGSSFHEVDYREQIAGTEFNSVTGTIYFGWTSWDRDNPTRFSGLDLVVAWAIERQLPVHGHVLLYPASTRDRFVDEMPNSEVVEHIQEFVSSTAARFAGKIYVWDVVNEVIADDNDIMDDLGLRTHWYGNGADPVRDYHAFGGSAFVEDAFVRARTADPNALLIINDYGVGIRNAKSDRLFAYARYLRDEAAVPIDGVGFQHHWTDPRFTPQVEQIVENMQRFVDVGFRVFVTELDVVATSSRQFPSEAEQQRQRDVFRNVVQACLAVVGCEACWLWDFSDDLSWLGPTTFATPFWNKTGGFANAKPAYYGVQQALEATAETYTMQSWWGIESFLGRNGLQDSTGTWIPQETVSLQAFAPVEFDHLRFVFDLGPSGTYRIRSRWGEPSFLTRNMNNTVSLRPFAQSSSQEWLLERVLFPFAELDFGNPGDQRVSVYRLRNDANYYLTRDGELDASGEWIPLASVTVHDGLNASWLSQLWTLGRGN